MRVLKMISRGAVSPIVTPDTVVIAPKDASGLIGFDRRTGAIRWQDELLDAPYLCGICGDRILMAGASVRAIQLDNGATAWEYPLTNESVYGQPGFSGEMLYLPTEDRLHVIDAKTGKLQAAYPWDPRVGPLGNLTITANAIVGVNTHYVAAISAGGAHVDLPLLQARNALLEGNTELCGEFAQGGAERRCRHDARGWLRQLRARGCCRKLNKKATISASPISTACWLENRSRWSPRRSSGRSTAMYSAPR